jgi:hypothetical protein
MCKDGQMFCISGICKLFRHIQDTGISRRSLQVIFLDYMMYILFFPFNFLQLFLKKSMIFWDAKLKHANLKKSPIFYTEKCVAFFQLRFAASKSKISNVLQVSVLVPSNTLCSGIGNRRFPKFGKS